jgi:hypothetical protein
VEDLAVGADDADVVLGGTGVVREPRGITTGSGYSGIPGLVSRVS